MTITEKFHQLKNAYGICLTKRQRWAKNLLNLRDELSKTQQMYNKLKNVALSLRTSGDQHVQLLTENGNDLLEILRFRITQAKLERKRLLKTRIPRHPRILSAQVPGI